MKKQAVIANWKKGKVDHLVEQIKKYPIIGIVDMSNLPSLQVQRMRSSLRNSVQMIMCKRRLIKLAIDHCKDQKKGLEELQPYVKGMPALILTKDNPFALAKTLRKSKSKAPAKAGQVAPNDIVIPAGATPFSPGPIIGELGAIGVKTGIENGKVAVKADSVVVKEGETVTPAVASILTRLNIEPMEIGLNIQGVYENGIIFTKKVLDVDDAQYLADLKNLAREALNLACFIEYPTKDTIELLVGKAHRDALGLAESQGVITSETLKTMVAKANFTAKHVASSAKFEVSEEIPKGEPVGFVKEEEVAQDVLKKLQERKIQANKT